MRYAIVDVELTEPLPSLSLGAGDGGIAVLVRRRQRPIDFFLEPLAPSSRLEPSELAELLGARSPVAILRDSVREELAEPLEAPALSLSIAVCTRGRPRELERCLKSLLELSPPSTGQAPELLVVDNAPPDLQTEKLVATLPAVRYSREPCPGLDVARNRALQEATGELVAFLDDDVVVDRGWLAGLEEAIAENPDVAVVTGLVLPLELESRAQLVFELRGGFGRGFAKLRYHGQELPGNPLYPTGAGIFGAGCNMVLRRDAVLALGGFDEALDTGPPLPGGGDLDIFYRVVRAGLPLVYEPRMLVFHEHRREWEALRRQYWTWGTGFMAFVTKTYGADVPQRPKLRRLVRWWVRNELRELVESARRESAMSPDLVAAELAGGLVGLAGTYRRSAERMRRLREGASA